MKQIIAFIVSILILSVYGIYAVLQLKTLGTKVNEAVEHRADLVIRQLLENPGNWSVSPPSIGLAVSEEGQAGKFVYPYVIDVNKLSQLISLNYSTLRAGLSLGDYDVRIVFYYYNESSESFPESPSLVVGSSIIGEVRATRHVLARLSNGTLCEVRVIVSGG